MIDLPTVLTDLALERPVFHSEADFQHALAWRLHETLPEADVRLECQAIAGVHLDIWLRTGHGSIAIELKYVTKRLTLDLTGERFNLTNHGAQPPRRYDFIKDITRLERVVQSIPDAIGYAVFLTNDDLYWTRSTREDGIGTAFRFHEGRILDGTLRWAGHAAPGTTAGRESPLVLGHAYPVRWHDYSRVCTSKSGLFRHVVVGVEPQRSSSGRAKRRPAWCPSSRTACWQDRGPGADPAPPPDIGLGEASATL